MRNYFSLAALAASASAAVYTDRLYFQRGDPQELADIAALGYTSFYDTTTDTARRNLIDEISPVAKTVNTSSNRDGLLNADELIALLENLNYEEDKAAAVAEMMENYDTDGDGKLYYNEFMRGIYVLRGGPDEPWTVWPGTQAHTAFYWAMLYGDTTVLNDELRAMGFTSLFTDLPRQDPFWSKLYNFCQWWNQGKGSYPNGLRDTAGIATVIQKEGTYTGDMATQLNAAAMSKDEDEDGKISFFEFMNTWQEWHGEGSQMTIWPNFSCWGTTMEPIFWMWDARPEPMCELNDELTRIGYNITYDNATAEEQTALDELIDAADTVVESPDGMMGVTELASIQLLVWSEGSDGAEMDPATLLQTYDGDADGLINFRELMRLFSAFEEVDIADVWPCYGRLPLRFRLHPDVVGDLVNPIFCAESEQLS